jgi:hypothetical protein
VLGALDWDDYIERVDDSRPLYLMRAGRFDDSYGERVDRLDWDALFCACPALFRHFAAQLGQRFAHVLVDCRSGRSAAASVCTALLPDKLVALFSPDPRSLDGLRGVIARAFEYRCSHEDEQRPLLVYPVPAPIEAGFENVRAGVSARCTMPRRCDGARGYQAALESPAGRMLRPVRPGARQLSRRSAAAPGRHPRHDDRRPAAAIRAAATGSVRCAASRPCSNGWSPAMCRGVRWPRCAWCRPPGPCAGMRSTSRRRRWCANWPGLRSPTWINRASWKRRAASNSMCSHWKPACRRSTRSGAAVPARAATVLRGRATSGRATKGRASTGRPAKSSTTNCRASRRPAPLLQVKSLLQVKCESLSVTTTATSHQASRPWPMRSPVADIVVVAPDSNRSGASNSLSLDRPLSISKAANGFYFVNGTPTDCVHIALTGMLDYRPDLVVSGINNGQNMGDDTLYSGTVAAATEAYLFGIPAIAFSQVHGGWSEVDRRRRWRATSCCAAST